MNLNRLNELLMDPNLDLPYHRRRVDKSGQNLVWLNKHIQQRNAISQELKTLLSKSIFELTR
jgi:hypothetical protein